MTSSFHISTASTSAAIRTPVSLVKRPYKDQICAQTASTIYTRSVKRGPESSPLLFREVTHYKPHLKNFVASLEKAQMFLDVVIHYIHLLLFLIL